MNVISVCSGAGGMDLGFERAGHRTVALCEWLPWLRELLAARFPGVPCWPDLAELDPATLPAADLLIGGTPCQDLSISGRRAGLEGAKSSLFWDFCRIRNATGVEWCCWENVAGALSSNNGLDFSCVLGALVGADVPVPRGGWGGFGVVTGPWGGAVWRVLDSQWFGVPQRRRRVFVVGHLGGACPPEVLLEPDSGRRHPEARNGSRQEAPDTFGLDVAGALGALTGGSRTTDLDGHGAYVGAAPDPHGVRAADGVARSLDVSAVIQDGRDMQKFQNGLGVVEDGPAYTLDCTGAQAVAITENQRGEVWETPYSSSLSGQGGKPGQGYAAVRIEGELAAGNTCTVDPPPDNRRYSACGNGVVAPVAEWIGRRLTEVAG